MLVPALKTKKFRRFVLESVDFGGVRDGMGFVVDAIKGNPSLKEFKWVGSGIDNMNGMNHLIQSISAHPSIEHVNMFCCGVGLRRVDVDGYEVLCSLIERATNLTYINLNRCAISTKGRCHRPDFLARNPPLCELHLEENFLEDDDAVSIAAALKGNRTLTDLTLFGRE